MRAIILAAVVFLFSSTAMASDAISAKITRIHGWKNPAPKGSVYIDVGYARPDYPCPYGSGREYYLNMNDPWAEAYYSHILAAFSAGSPIDVVGSGLCMMNAETISELRLRR